MAIKLTGSAIVRMLGLAVVEPAGLCFWEEKIGRPRGGIVALDVSDVLLRFVYCHRGYSERGGRFAYAESEYCS